jgi:renalase
MNKKSCLIIGAGITGLMAAVRLKENGIDVTLLEKSSGVGGRMATRRIEGSVFDHGAQYFTMENKIFKDYATKWLEKGILKQWPSQVNRSLPEPFNQPVFIGKNGMTALPKFLAQNLPIKLNRRITIINYRDNQWEIISDADEFFKADAMILTAPLPQSLDLIKSGNLHSANGFYHKLDAISYYSCLALMVLTKGKVDFPEPGAIKLSGEPLSWIADNSQKEISRGNSAITIHAGNEFSRKYWEMENDALAKNILYIASDWIDAEYDTYQLKRWTYSQPRSLYPERHFFLTTPLPLALAGDAFAEGGVEGAALSGLAAAEAILNALF